MIEIDRIPMFLKVINSNFTTNIDQCIKIFYHLQFNKHLHPETLIKNS